MHHKKELCRNFQRGSCQYGERCKFLHVTQQQSKPNNPFGFGTQQQQQKSNPFGFGVQNSPQAKGARDFGNKPQQFKPFENKWTRFSPISNSDAPSSRQADNQSQTVNHKCTDADACKRVIAEDFQNERPLWQLTCYGHWKNAPCDIIGDISYEELRAMAYDDAKHQKSLQSIVERERNLLNARLIEFENLLRNPYKAPSQSGLSNTSPFPGATPNAALASGQNGAPLSASSFSQLGASLNSGLGARPSAPSTNAFGQPNPFSTSSQTSNVFEARPSATLDNTFAQPNIFSNSSQGSVAFGMNNTPSGNAGLFGSQLPNQAFGSSFPSNIAGFGKSSPIGSQSNSFSSFAVSTPNPSASNIQPPVISNGSYSAFDAVEQITTDIRSVKNIQTETVSGDASIWLKEIWTPGEIPEEAPPESFVF